MPQLMHGFPPSPDTQVSLANWRQPPFAQWGFQHVREIVPTADIANDPDAVWKLPAAARDFAGLKIDGGAKGEMSLEAWNEATSTDGLVILHKGRVVYERYRTGMTPTTPHILMSVTKSVLGLLCGILQAKGVLDPDKLVTDVIPEMKSTAYAGATIRNLLDMRTGVAFDEDYLATTGAIIAYRKSTNWNPLSPGESPTDLRSFYQNLTDSVRPHGQDFHYISPNTDLLGWVVERAAGRRFADLVSELIWQPLGAHRSAYITVDRLGAPRAAGGMCVTTSDLARLGQLLVQKGVRDGRQIIPAAWIDDIVKNGDPEAWNKGPFTPFFPGADMHYRAKCYITRGSEPVIMGLGVHGQYLVADLKNEVVIAKHSSEAMPLDAGNILLTMAGFKAIRAFTAKG